jgi:inner membrane protein
VNRRTIALASVATVLAADWTIRKVRPPWLLIGLLDEPAHVATAALVLVNLPERSPEWSAGFMAGSVLPDVDHVPLLFSRTLPQVDDPRPVTHGLLALAAPTVIGAVASGPLRDYARGAAAGGLAHFARDLAVGTGVTLLRPLTRRSFRVPHPLYTAALVALAIRGASRR